MKKSKFTENVRTLLWALLVVMVVRSMIIAPYKIPSGSMIPTLQIGDRIFVSKFTYGLKLPFTNINLLTWDEPEAGEVVVFRFPKDPSKDYIKRVVGIPGDEIETRQGMVYVNGQAQNRHKVDGDTLINIVEGAVRRPEAYELYEEQTGKNSHYSLYHSGLSFSKLRNSGPVKVPEGHYFVMGDNRDNSRDSREWGFVPFKSLRGRALAVFFSLKNNPWGIRWNRIGKLIH